MIVAQGVSTARPTGQKECVSYTFFLEISHLFLELAEFFLELLLEHSVSAPIRSIVLRTEGYPTLRTLQLYIKMEIQGRRSSGRPTNVPEFCSRFFSKLDLNRNFFEIYVSGWPRRKQGSVTTWLGQCGFNSRPPQRTKRAFFALPYAVEWS